MPLPARLALLLIVTAVAGCGLIVRKPEPPPLALALPPARTVSVSGAVECLAPRITDASGTPACAIGLRDAAGRFYRLREFDPAAPKLSGIAIGELVLVAGALTPASDTRFASAGDVWVLAVSRLEGP